MKFGCLEFRIRGMCECGWIDGEGVEGRGRGRREKKGECCASTVQVIIGKGKKRKKEKRKEKREKRDGGEGREGKGGIG